MDLTTGTKIVLFIVMAIMTIFAYASFMMGSHKDD